MFRVRAALIGTGFAGRQARADAPGFRHIRQDRTVASDPKRCLRFRSAYGRCTACEEACPAAALRVSEKAITLADPCTGCGRCAAACPTGALAVEGFAPVPPAASDGPLYLDCWKVPASQSPAGAARVPCLGGIALDGLLDWQSPSRAVVLLDRGWCAGCSSAGGDRHPAQLPLQRARGLLAALGVAESALPRLERRPLPQASMPTAIPDAWSGRALDRRAFFQDLTRRAAHAVGPSSPAPADAPVASRLSSHFADTPRSRLLARAAEIGLRHGRPLPARLFPALRVSDACTNHGICAAMCPVGALQRYENADTAGIVFDAGSCISCGDCTRACPERALELDGQGGDAVARATAALTRWPVRACRECGDRFATAASENRCPACAKARDIARAGFAQLFGAPPDCDLEDGGTRQESGQLFWKNRQKEQA